MVGVANSADGYSLDEFEFLKPFIDVIGSMIHAVKLSTELDFQKKLSFHSAKLASIGELAAGVGHEINNPLAVISGQLEMLKFDLEDKALLDEKIELKITKSLRSVERISRITNGLKEFARLDGNEFLPFNVSDLLNETIEMLFEIYSKENIVFICDIQKDLLILGNRGRIQQVFINLLNNSRDAMLSSIFKEIKVTASILKNDIIISVSDSGPGVPDNLKHKIFEPFFTTKEINKGTGIGLALVSSIIVEHNGLITIENDTNPGACFKITLPSHTPALSGKQLSQKVEKTRRIKAKGKILIVDDEYALCESLKELLELFGLDVIIATNGKEALTYILENYSDINLIISDIKMPLMDGIELAKTVKDLNLYKGGFLLMTGGVNSKTEDFSGFSDGVLIKPFYMADVIELIKKWVDVE